MTDPDAGSGIDFRLPVVALTTWATTLLSLWAEPPWWVWLIVSVLSGFAAWLTARTGLRLVAVSCVLAGCAGLSTSVHLELRQPPLFVEAVEQGPVEITVRLTHTATESSTYLRGDILSSGEMAVPRIPVMLTGVELSDRWPIGTTLRTTTRLTALPALDSRGWLGRAGEPEVVSPAPAVVRAADSLREGLLLRSQANGGDAGALLPGLSLGDTTAVSSSLEEAMRRASLSHLVAVSGANVALVVGSVVAVVALLGGGVRWRTTAGLAAIAGFVLLVTPESSVVRASVMAAIVLVVVLSGRPSRGIPALALTAWVLVLLDPWKAVDIAFALSVLATGGILLGVQPLADRLKRFLPTPLAWLVALPLIAQVSVWPLIVTLRPTVPVWGVVANIVATPAVALVTVTGVLAALIGPLWPWLADVLVWWGWWPAGWIAGIAHTVSALPAAELPFLSGAGGVAVALVACLGVWAWLLGRWGTTPLVVSALAVSWGVSSVVFPRVVTLWSIPAAWEVAQCDVGQGDALVLRSGSDTVLIDTGDNPQALDECLAVLGVSRLDLLVLTHFDRDHVGAVATIQGRSSRVISGPPENDKDQRLLDGLSASGATIQRAREGDTLRLENHLLHVLWPTSPALTSPGNDQSIVVWAEPLSSCASCLSFVALGDVGQEAQRHLVPRLPAARVDVVKVSHHGSADQLPELYRELGAPVSLIGVGAHNTYGHPTPSLRAVLEGLGSHIVRSDRDGLAVVWRGGEGDLRVWSEGGS